MKRRARRLMIGALTLAAVGIALTAGMFAATVPLSWRYEISDIFATIDDFQSIAHSEAEKLKTVAELVMECYGGDDGGLIVLPDGKALVVTGTILQQWDVGQIVRKLRSFTVR